MLRRCAAGLVATALILSISSISSLAGGWAAVALDSLPVQVRAGQALHLGFTVRQHATRPVDHAEPVLFAENAVTGESLQVEAQQEGEIGHYVVKVTFPSSGTWEWGIDPKPWGRIAHFEPLTVLPTAAETTPSRATAWWPVIPALVFTLGLVLAARRRLMSVRASASVAVLATMVFIVFMQSSLAVEGYGSSPFPADAGYGRALFVAKGCHACHYGKVSTIVHGPITGPDLANYRADPDFLRTWLRDPQAVRPDTRMPDLGLSTGEIEALIAFFNHGVDQ